MPASPFSAEVVAAADPAGVARIDLHGDIDGNAEVGLSQAYSRAASDTSASVMLDFSDVTFMNSTGIALIVQLLARAREEGRELRAFGLSSHYREIFDITRLSDFIRVCDDEASALADPAATRTPTTTGGPA